MKQIIILLVMLSAVLFIPAVIAQTEEPLHMTLLAVREEGDNFIGSTADLYLEIQEGKERVFLDTYPLTKIDTQISTRFAQEIACNYFDINCNNKDFIYTIRADSSIIGGPSAGASIAALTTAGLLGLPVDEDVAVTGTINSGGLIGPVGGLKGKIEAAAAAGIGTVLIPFGTRFINESANNTSTFDWGGNADLIEYGRLLNITVVEVTDLNEVVDYVSGKRLLDDGASVVVDSEYSSIMRDVSEELCSRSGTLNKEVIGLLNKTEREDISNTTAKAAAAATERAYYSAASYCFGLNINLHYLLYKKQNFSEAKIQSKATQLSKDIERFENEVRQKELRTIADLQAFTVVLERLNAAKEYIEKLENEEDKRFLLAIAEERFFSSQAWASFFEMDGRKYEFNKEVLQKSCTEKIQEAEERHQYVQLFLSSGIGHIDDGIQQAMKHRDEEDYEQCLITASEAKANANAILSTIGIESRQLRALVDAKLHALEAQIFRTIEKRAFPLLGFSYYEYAQSLKNYDEASALLYAEYALEMSNLDIYFKEEQSGVEKLGDKISLELALVFAAGAVVGALLVALIYSKKPKRRKKAK